MMMKVKEYFPTSILLSERQYEGLRRLVAAGKFRSVSEAVRVAVDALLEREGVLVEREGEEK